MIKSADFALPEPADFRSQYGSANADDEPASDNYRGVKSRVVDHLIAKMEQARTMDELRDAARALDRVFIHEH